MDLTFYLDNFYKFCRDDTPVIIRGKNQNGIDSWFYVSKKPIYFPNMLFPRIFLGGTEVFVKRNRYEKTRDTIEDSSLHQNLNEDYNKNYLPGELIDQSELVKIFEEGKIGPAISNFSGIFYTINVQLSGDISYGGTSFISYNNLVNNNQFMELGKSNKYPSYDLFIFSDPNVIKREWPRLISKHPEFKDYSSTLDKAGIRVNIK